MTLEQLIEKIIPELSEAFSLAIADIVDRVTLKDIAQAVQLGDIDRAFRLLGYNEAAMRPVTATIERAYEAGGAAVGATFPKRLVTPDGPAVFRFDIRNIRAEKWVREKSASLVERIGNDTLNNMRNIISTGLENGRNPKNIALDIVGRIDPVKNRRIGGIIGINQRQQLYVANMRRDLENLDQRYFTRKLRNRKYDSIVQRAFEKGNVDSSLTNSLVSGYHDSMLKLRGNTIARDATIEALRGSEFEAMKQAQEMGAIGNRGVKRYWDSSGPDGITRDDHLYMDRQPPVGIDEPFVFPDGTKVMFPQDRSLPNNPRNLAKQTISCRCGVRTEIDWLRDLN